METKENKQQNLDILLRMYEKQLDRWNRRRDDEWKITITFWTGAFVSTGFLANKLKLEVWHLSLYVIIWIIYVFWLRGVWTANAKDKTWASVYKSRIDISIEIEPTESMKKYKEPNPLDFLKDWSMRFQAIFTFALLLLCWYTLYILPVKQG